MSIYDLLKAFHILLFVFWLGTDIGVFYMGLMVQNQGYDPKTRMALAEAMHFLDQFPRTCLILMIPVGIALARLGGFAFAEVSGEVLWAIALLAVVWAVASVLVTGFGSFQKARSVFLVADRAYRLVLVVLAVFVIGKTLGGEGLIAGRWLVFKVALFATILLAGAIIDFLPNPFAALLEIGREGSTPQREEALRRGLTLIYPVVVYIYLALVAMLLLSVTRI